MVIHTKQKAKIHTHEPDADYVRDDEDYGYSEGFEDDDDYLSSIPTDEDDDEE